MKTLLAFTILAAQVPQFVVILFWIILALWVIGVITPVYRNVNYVRGSSVVIIILFAILGYAVFKFGP